MVDLAGIALARYRLSRYLQPTPLEDAPGLGADVWLKLENANKTHSFKIRGALNAMLSLDEAQRARGIIAASSGNHAQGIAYAAHVTSTRARVVMPRHTPQRKLAGVRRYGGEAILVGDYAHEAEQEARRIEQAEGIPFISPYNDPQVVAGAGTIGLEILDSLPEVERVIAPVSGGGLISGIAVALKSLRPQVEVIGVNAAAGTAMYNALYGTDYPDSYETLADALPGDIEAGSITLDLARRYVDRVVLVSEEAVADAMRFLVREQGWIAEGGGAVGVAALLCGAVPQTAKKTAVIISGGNIDAAALARVLSDG